MSLAGTMMATGMIVGSLAMVRMYAERGQMKWVANRLAEGTGKPTINIGAKRDKWGDVRCDIHPQGGCVYCDAENMSEFADKTFSVAVVSHVLEHLEHPERALKEAQRIADNVMVVLPSPTQVWTWVVPDHRWVFLGSNKVAIDPALIASILATAGLGVIIGLASTRGRK